MEYTQPVKVGDEVEVEIINIGEKGDGVAKHENFVILVPSTDIGDKVRVKIKKVFAKFGIGEKV